MPDPSCLEKKISVICCEFKGGCLQNRGQIEMENNSKNTSDANGVHLEGNFLFSLSFFVTRNRNF